ncbi:MAG: solute carrier family 26 protein [Saprospiraceae bacterium]|nr:solute carrier family 26 protein [Saprospiraceae bacterium]
MRLSNIVPAVGWLSRYDRSDLRGDLTAGITIGVLLIAQGMAYAMIAGMPPIYGLYASTVPLIVYALLGTSRHLAVGPTAVVSLLTLAAISPLAEVGSAEYIQLALILALLVGLLQFGLGLFKLGFLVNFLSHPVISGFTSAAAIIIGISQLKHLLGLEISRGHNVFETLIHIITNISDSHTPTMIVGFGGIAVLLLLRWIHRMIPSQLVVVLGGVIFVWLLGLSDQGVAIVGTIPEGLPSFVWNGFSLEQLQSLLPAAMAIALIGFMESYAVAQAIQSKHKYYIIKPNQELLALGLANILGSMFQSFPTTGGFSRTAVNNQAGAKTGLASMISALLVVLILLFLTQVFYFLPLAVLAAIIVVAVIGLIDAKHTRHLWHADRSDFWMLMVTFLTTLILGIEEGIAVGVAISLVMVIYRSTKPHIAELGKVLGTRTYRNISRFEHLETRDDLLLFRFDAQLYFANTNVFKNVLERMMTKKGASLKAVILDAQSINHVDSSAMHVLEDILEELEKQSVQMLFADVKGPVRDAMAKYGLTDQIGRDRFFMDVQSAVDFFDHGASSTLDPEGTYTSQTNI